MLRAMLPLCFMVPPAGALRGYLSQINRYHNHLPAPLRGLPPAPRKYQKQPLAKEPMTPVGP
jgi:hypothetical protein